MARFLAFVLLHTVVDVLVQAQRPVYPLIVDGVAPNGARVGGSSINNDQPSALSASASKESRRMSFVLSANSQYVRTSGNSRTCSQHSDCYALREPDEWCSSPNYDQTYDKGCFCELRRGQCVIERQGPSGNSEYTDCTEKSSSKCSRGSAAVRPDIQFSEISSSNSVNSNDILLPKNKETGQQFSLSPQSVYVRTTAEAKTCKIHDDCYALREPDDWCPLASSDRYFDKGCFCEASSQRCFIERQTASGSEYSDCAPKATSKCQAVNNGQYSDIQKVSGEDQKSKSDEKRLQNARWAGSLGLLTVSPQGRYVGTSGQPRTCLYHQDCYLLREPNEWCPLPASDRYFEKGCFCDYARSVCTIEREVPGGSEYTDCAEKTASTCQSS